MEQTECGPICMYFSLRKHTSFVVAFHVLLLMIITVLVLLLLLIYHEHDFNNWVDFQQSFAETNCLMAL